MTSLTSIVKSFIPQSRQSTSQSESFAEGLNENTTENLNEKKHTTMDFGQDIGLMNSTGSTVIQLDKVTGLVLKTALEKLLTEKDKYSYFCITQLDRIMESTGLGNFNHPNYKKLRMLHCVNFCDMPRELKAILPQMVNEILTQPAPSAAAEKAMQGIVY